MIAAVIALAIGAGILGAALVVLALVIKSLVTSVTAADERARVATEEQLKQRSSMDEAEGQRDKALEAEAAARSTADSATKQLAATQKQLASASAELVKRVQAEMAIAKPQDVLDEVNRLLAGGS